MKHDHGPAWDPLTGELDRDETDNLLIGLRSIDRAALAAHFPVWAHPGQTVDPADPKAESWRTWVIMAGRGFGKTLAGAEWLTAEIARHKGSAEPLAIALVGATIEDARRVMVEGRSGLMTVAANWIAAWRPSLNQLAFTTGATATLFSGASPDRLRGPEHHLAWCDELAKWERGADSWDMLQLGLRLGTRPRALITTTPRAGPLLTAIIADPDTLVTGGSTHANPHTPEAFKTRVHTLYAGTRLGAQELDGQLLTDTPGALWSVELLERCRLQTPLPAREGLGVGATPALSRGSPPPSHESASAASSHLAADPPPSPPLQGGEPYARVVIGVDPPSGDGTCGIIACALDEAGKAHVLADHSLTAVTPETWARAVADAARIHSTLNPSPGTGEGMTGSAMPPAWPKGRGALFARSSHSQSEWEGEGRPFLPSPSMGEGGLAAGEPGEGANEQSREAPFETPIRTTTAWRQAHAPRPVTHPIPVLVVAEVNQGGRMVESILRAADPALHVRRVTATVGKAHRAEPIARLFEAGQVVLHGRFPELEAELLGMIAGGGYEAPSSGGRGAPGKSPDRADAMVWALTELMLARRGGPQVRSV